eukprot:TRINITY_DN66571_c13_g1_i4.p1 TRINITY_DN66571_c13_g1~~TRINITY_DN66571_c13_g1_i4.p1  ORF type:complete len:653 (-),score=310.85 TRINITY_DN66571_c13_g1_i4:758-2716(-)
MDQPAKRPRLRQFDDWGRRVDEVVTCAEWKKMKRVASEEGIVAHGYVRRFGSASRLFQFAKLYMFHPSSGMFTCPLAMTDGAARMFERMLAHNRVNKAAGRVVARSRSFVDRLSPHTEWLISQAFQRLTSMNAQHFWTSGQWMTERKGGSDVGDGTETVARLQPDGSYKLSGFKWFTSATDADMTITLARIEDAQTGKTVGGSRGLSCFLVPVQRRHINFTGPDDYAGEDAVERKCQSASTGGVADHGGDTLNAIRICQMKDKLGTKQLPTAELELVGSTGYLISKPGRGVATIVNMINVTRLYNSICASGFMRRSVALARDYTHRRTAFGKCLTEHALHLETLALMEIKTRASLLFTLDAVNVLGRIEQAETSGRQQSGDKSLELLLRLVTPLVKLFTGKIAVDVASEGIECFGGQGYIETTGVPSILRDAQVLPIWEGTTNVLSHDMLRVFAKTGSAAVDLLFGTIADNIAQPSGTQPAHMNQSRAVLHDSLLRVSSETVAHASEVLRLFIADEHMTDHRDSARAKGSEGVSRDLAYSLSRTYVGSLLIKHARWSNDERDVWTAYQWTCGNLHGVGALVAQCIVDRVGSRHPDTVEEQCKLARSRAANAPTMQDRARFVRALALDIDPSTREAQGHGAVDAHDGQNRARL